MAQQEAKANNKLLLLDFTGSDWCGWCIKLNKEVFSKPEFKDYANKNLVLMEVDFPRGKSQGSDIKKQNEGLAQQYQIEGFPTALFRWSGPTFLLFSSHRMTPSSRKT